MTRSVSEPRARIYGPWPLVATTTQSPNTCGNLLSCNGCDSPRACFWFHVSRSVGRTGMRWFSLASPLRLSSHFCPSVSFGLTLAHNCLLQGIAHSTLWCHSSPKLRVFHNNLSILLVSHTGSIHRHRSTASSDLSACRPSSTINSVTFLAANSLSTF